MLRLRLLFVPYLTLLVLCAGIYTPINCYLSMGEWSPGIRVGIQDDLIPICAVVICGLVLLRPAARLIVKERGRRRFDPRGFYYFATIGAVIAAVVPLQGWVRYATAELKPLDARGHAPQIERIHFASGFFALAMPGSAIAAHSLTTRKSITYLHVCVACPAYPALPGERVVWIAMHFTTSTSGSFSQQAIRDYVQSRVTRFREQVLVKPGYYEQLSDSDQDLFTTALMTTKPRLGPPPAVFEPIREDFSATLADKKLEFFLLFLVGLLVVLVFSMLAPFEKSALADRLKRSNPVYLPSS